MQTTGATMTKEQFERWRDFSTRMAATCLPHLRLRPSKQWVIDQVDEFFRDNDPFCEFNDDWLLFVRDWDNTDPYPEGHKYHGKSNWGSGLNTATYVCDYMVEVFDLVRPAFRCRACKQRAWDEDYDEARACRCEDMEDMAYEQWDNQWASPVTCCIRAGLDMAVGPSAGVLGFTVGDLRRMYPNGFPEWLTSRFDDDLDEAADEIGVWL